MRVAVKGLHSTYKHLASGETRVYWYAWRGGPRLKGKLGTPEFMASYNAALASRPAATLRNDKVLEALVDAYLDSQNFLKLRDRTQADYRRRFVVAAGHWPECRRRPGRDGLLSRNQRLGLGGPLEIKRRRAFVRP
jgi:hypothetical protein